MPKHLSVKNINEEHIYGIPVVLQGKEAMVSLHFSEIPADASETKWTMAGHTVEPLQMLFRRTLQEPIETHTAAVLTVSVRNLFQNTAELKAWKFERISLNGSMLDSVSIARLRTSVSAK